MYSSGGTYAVSTYVDSSGTPQCPSESSTSPPPVPMAGQPWSPDRLTVDCAGAFRLCYTIKAGDASAPSPGDCVVGQSCVEAWYSNAGMTQELPPLPAWTGMDPACAAQFEATGGYGEMSVHGLSVECDPVDDGMGGDYVFNRVNYCPSSCNTDPSGPGCAGCMAGGSGSF